ncbi:MAG TPA: tRNA adenosine(34) deaminase TadA [Dissulfurispiraceae bacterium]|nr:tRNA adenosine(34) deaminase TadA [Dissulfurispiraceae bacterium]
MDCVASDDHFMKLALREAEKAYRKEEVPVGAVLVIDGKVAGRAHNIRESQFDPTGHAETIVLRRVARRLKRWRLSDATLYVTKEPCVMCAGVIMHARLGRLVYGCGDAKGGAQSLFQIFTDLRLNHRLNVQTGVCEAESAALLKRFFAERRKAVRGDHESSTDQECL